MNEGTVLNVKFLFLESNKKLKLECSNKNQHILVNLMLKFN